MALWQSLGCISKQRDKGKLFIVLGSSLGDLKVDFTKQGTGLRRGYDPIALDWVAVEEMEGVMRWVLMSELLVLTGKSF